MRKDTQRSFGRGVIAGAVVGAVLVAIEVHAGLVALGDPIDVSGKLLMIPVAGVAFGVLNWAIHRVAGRGGIS